MYCQVCKEDHDRVPNRVYLDAERSDYDTQGEICLGCESHYDGEKLLHEGPQVY